MVLEEDNMDAESAKTERTKAKRLLTMAITSMDKAITAVGRMSL